MEDYMADNAAAVEEAAGAPAEAEAAAAEDGAAAVETGKPQSGRQAETRAFSRRLNQMTAKAVDDFVSGMGWTNEITGEKITTRKQYETYSRMRQAQASGQDPVLSAELSQLKGELNRYRVNEQDAALSADPDMGEVYSAVRDDVLGLVRYCHDNGRTDVDVSAAFQAVLQKNAGKIFKDLKTKASADTIAKSKAAAKASPGKLGGGDVRQSVDYSRMSDDEFERQIAAAKRGALKAR